MKSNSLLLTCVLLPLLNDPAKNKLAQLEDLFKIQLLSNFGPDPSVETHLTGSIDMAVVYNMAMVLS